MSRKFAGLPLLPASSSMICPPSADGEGGSHTKWLAVHCVIRAFTDAGAIRRSVTCAAGDWDFSAPGSVASAPISGKATRLGITLVAPGPQRDAAGPRGQVLRRRRGPTHPRAGVPSRAGTQIQDLEYRDRE